MSRAATTHQRGVSTQPKPKRHSHTRAPRWQSRRSSTRQVNRTRARQRPSTHPKPKRRSQPQCAPAAKPPQLHPAGQSQPRETKGPDVRIRQNKPHPTRISGPKQPAPGSGEPRKRLKLRSALLKNVSCLGMTTQKVSASKRFHRTQRRQKALFFGAYPVSFGKTKEMGYKCRA